jgi:LuxR family maltose regulon positive regulatory protein
LQSLVHQARTELELSLKVLRQAISLAEPAGYVRVFLDEGLPMRALLRQAASRGIAPDYVERLLAMFKTEARGPDQIEKTSGSPLIEPLTARELQVLRLIAAGHSNQEIAEILLLAVGTVKRHISNVYAKLNVEKRTQAVACARELGLI